MILFLAYAVLAFTLIQLLVAIVNLCFETNLPVSEIVRKDLISVLIPARNEEKNIGNVLEDLISQDYPNFEVIAFNDQSDDRTAEIVTEYTIRDKRIQLYNSSGLPEGWLGKNFACHSLAEKATGKYLLFLDADVRIGNKVINRALSFSTTYDLGLISIFPKQVIRSHGERITVPNMNFILASLLPLVLVRKTNFSSIAAANGQFMFFECEKYKSLWPHEKMKNEKVEDISIARAYKKKGLKVACLLGDDMITCRMYTGFYEAVKGFSKNVTAFFGNSFVLALLFWLITSFGFIPVLLKLPLALFFIYLIAYMLVRIIISAVSRQNLFFNLLYILPLQLSLFLFIYNSFLNRYFRKFEWKGRVID